MTKRLVLFFALATSCLAQVDIHTIIQRSVEANTVDWKAAPNYDDIERDQQPGGGTKTYEVLMLFGTPYERLVAINGKPLPPDQQDAEQHKMEAVINQRKNESPSDRAERIAKYEKDRKRDHLLIDQLTEAFDFSLLGEQNLNGHGVYVLKATPRPGYQPPNMEAKVLTGMQGNLWIDKKTFQWVKVQAQVIHPVSIEGFLARVEPGTRFELEKSPIEDDIWLPSHFSMKARAKVLFFVKHASQADETYYDYHKAPAQMK